MTAQPMARPAPAAITMDVISSAPWGRISPQNRKASPSLIIHAAACPSITALTTQDQRPGYAQQTAERERHERDTDVVRGHLGEELHRRLLRVVLLELLVDVVLPFGGTR